MVGDAALRGSNIYTPRLRIEDCPSRTGEGAELLPEGAAREPGESSRGVQGSIREL